MITRSNISLFFYAFISTLTLLPLSAQPYGYPYDPYNFPEDLYYWPNSPNYRSSYAPPSPYYRPNDPYNRPGRPPVPSMMPPRPLGSSTLPPSLRLQPPQQQAPREPSDNPTEDKIDQILHFWFGPLSSPIAYPADKISLWEGTSEEVPLISKEFMDDYQRAVLGQYNGWRESPRGRLALIILLDQFPRHIFADTPRMFSSDAMARGLTLEGVQKGDDLSLYPIERAFFYMPLQHAEDPKMQAYSVEEYQRLVNQTPLPIRPIMVEFLRLAIKHQEIIARFGRFPHRNKVLGRQSTPEEMVYLGHKSTFRY